MLKLMHWDRAVAMPAPMIPIWKTKINSGSNPMFSSAPRQKPNHRQGGPPFVAEDVVHHITGNVERRSRENTHAIRFGIR